MKILALATCFNRKNKTIKAINSLMNGNKSINFDFIICDDNSSDGTCEELLKYKNVEVIKGTGSLYWAGGMRKAIELALKKDNYDYCMLFNDDVDFFEQSIEKLSFDNNTVLIGATCDDDGNLTYGGVIKKSKLRPKFEKVKGQYCDTFNANCVLIPWNIFIKMGNFDEVYTHQFADFDYGFKLVKNDYKLYATDEYVGCCNVNSNKGTYFDNSLSIKERLLLKNNPKKGLPTKEWFHFLNKNYSLFIAIVYFVVSYIKLLRR